MTLGKVLNLSEHQLSHLQKGTIISMHRVIVSTKWKSNIKKLVKCHMYKRQLKNPSDLDTHRLGSEGHGAHSPPLPEEQGTHHVTVARTIALGRFLLSQWSLQEPIQIN